MPRRKNPFAAEYKGLPIGEYPLPKSGFKYSAALEWALAAKWAGIPWPDFERMRGEKQSYIIAAYQTANMIEAIQSREENKRAETLSRVKKSGGRRRG